MISTHYAIIDNNQYSETKLYIKCNNTQLTSESIEFIKHAVYLINIFSVFTHTINIIIKNNNLILQINKKEYILHKSTTNEIKIEIINKYKQTTIC